MHNYGATESCVSILYIQSSLTHQKRSSIMIRLTILTLVFGLLGQVYAEERGGMGLPECELIVGSDRFIEIGNTISHTIEYMETNNYRCDDFQGKANEIVSCTYPVDLKFEVLLIVENGIVKDIETFYAGAECTYFNIKPFIPPEPKVN